MGRTGMGWRIVGRFAAVALFACSCSNGGGSSSGPAGVPRDTLVGSLTMQQLGALCDWANASIGGYGSIENCDGGGSAHAVSDQQSCIGKLCFTLPAGAFEDCFNAIGGSLCRAETEPKCMALANCPLYDGGGFD